MHVGKYDKATFVCLQHSDCRDKTPEDLPEDKQEVWEKIQQELASLKEDWMESVSYTHLDVYKRQDLLDVQAMISAKAIEAKAGLDAQGEQGIYCALLSYWNNL